MNFKRRSPKIFVSRLFGKLIPTFPTLVGCRRFRLTQRKGPWTPLISNPSSALSAVLKTGGHGGWSIAVVRWRMRCSLRRMDRRQCDRASELLGRTRSPSCTIFLPALVRRALFGLAEHRHHARQALARLPFKQHPPPHSHSTQHAHFFSSPKRPGRSLRPTSCDPFCRNTCGCLGARHYRRDRGGSYRGGSSSRSRPCHHVRPISILLLQY